MPIYNFRNTKTGEEKHDELISIAEMKQFLQDNPDWIVTPQLPPENWLLSDRKSTLTRAGTEWQDVLKKIQKGQPKKYQKNIHV